MGFLLLFSCRSTLQNYLKRHEGSDLKKGDASSSNPFEKGELLDGRSVVLYRLL